MISFRTNIPSLLAERHLADSTQSLARVSERLASGLRINHPSDDAAGLSIASSLEIDSRVYTQAGRNVNDGIGLLNIADGALDGLSQIDTRLRELATQSANGTLSNKQREALDFEAQSLAKEFSRIARTTEFNGTKLFDANSGSTSLQVGYGTLDTNLGGAISDGSFAAPATYSVGSFPYSVAVGDFNGDGVQDLVTGDHLSNALSVLLGRGDGTFGPRSVVPIGGHPISVAVADFNGDGVPDLASTDYSNSTATILLGRGDGNFDLKGSYSVPTDAISIASADLNSDGVQDLVTVDDGSNAVSVLLGRGDGTFNPQTSFAVGNSPRSVAIGDFNRDGIPDLMTTDYGDGSVSVLQGKGDGTFNPRTAISVGANPHAVSVGDFNGDGIPDALTANFGSDSVSVLLGRGDGTFSPQTSYAVGSQPYSVAVGDFNGDGNQDVVSSDYASNTVSILLGRGDGTLAPRTAYSVGSQPYSVAVGDFNRDGVQDLVTAEQGTSDVSVLLANTGDGVGAILPFSLATQDAARGAMTYFQQEQVRLSAQRAQIGATEARESYVVNALATTTEEVKAAKSRITDADIAEEAAKRTATEILQQAGAAVLAQANQQPALVLQLLHSA